MTPDNTDTTRIIENKYHNSKTAVFPGTFDPFTKGHESLVSRALNIVDEVVIAIGVNDLKTTFFSLEARIQMIRELYAQESRVQVKSYDTLTVDFAKDIGANFMIRGIRSVMDFEYEKAIADVNRKISGIETLVLFTEPEFASVNSSHVRELLRYNYDVSSFIPEGMNLIH